MPAIKLSEITLKNYNNVAIFLIHGLMEYSNVLKSAQDDILRSKSADSDLVVLIHERLGYSGGQNRETPHLFVKIKVSNKYEEVDVEGIESWAEVLIRVLNTEHQKVILFTLSHGMGFGIAKMDDRGSFDVGKFARNNELAVLFDDDSVSILKTKFSVIGFKNENLKNWEENDAKIFNDKNFTYLKEANAYVRNLTGISVFSYFENGDDGDPFKIPGKGDCGNIQVVWSYELNEILKKGLGSERKLDIVVMLNCHMLLYDNCHFLSEQVNFLIGAETLMDVNGLKYSEVLNLFYNTSKVNLTEIIGNFVDSYFIKQIQLANKPSFELLKRTAIFALDLQHFNAFKTYFEEKVIGFLLDEKFINKYRKQIIQLRNSNILSVSNTMASKNKSSIELVDLQNVITTLSQNLTLEDSDKMSLVRLDSELKNLLKPIIKYACIGPEIKFMDYVQAAKYRPSGISIFFPSIEVYNNRFGLCQLFPLNQTRTGLETQWDSFLKELYKIS